MTSKISEDRIAVMKDVFHDLHIPGGETVARYMEERVEKRRKEDMALRLNKAINEGAAKHNLRLLAQIILGLIKEAPTFQVR